MAKVLKFEEYMNESSTETKLSYTPGEIAGMAKQMAEDSGKMKNTAMLPVCGDLESPSVYLAVGYDKEYTKDVVCWFAFPKRTDEKTKGVFLDAMKSVAGDTYVGKDGITDGTLEKVLDKIEGNGITEAKSDYKLLISYKNKQ
jgi:hypothetical protein